MLLGSTVLNLLFLNKINMRNVTGLTINYYMNIGSRLVNAHGEPYHALIVDPDKCKGHAQCADRPNVV